MFVSEKEQRKAIFGLWPVALAEAGQGSTAARFSLCPNDQNRGSNQNQI